MKAGRALPGLDDQGWWRPMCSPFIVVLPLRGKHVIRLLLSSAGVTFNVRAVGSGQPGLVLPFSYSGFPDTCWLWSRPRYTPCTCWCEPCLLLKSDAVSVIELLSSSTSCSGALTDSVCALQQRNATPLAPRSSSPVTTAAVWIQDWSATRPRSAATAQTSRNARTVSTDVANSA